MKLRLKEEINWGDYTSWFDHVEEALQAGFNVTQDGDLILPANSIVERISIRKTFTIVNFNDIQIEIETNLLEEVK